MKYRESARRLEKKYGQNFAQFRQRILQSDPPYETEQDYFDWELAMTGIPDMEEEIRRLNEIAQPI